MSRLEEVIDALRSGLPILIFDDASREAEVDLVYPAWAAGPDEVYDLRVNAGGLICYATDSRVTLALGIPWGDELLANYNSYLKLLASRRLSYGDRPAFTIWVNHVGVRTGVSDSDRSLTVRKLDEVVKLYYEGRVDDARDMFYREFQAPGHVPILAARSLEERRGHTELSITLMKLAGLRPSVVLAEVLARGRSASLDEARDMAKRRRIPIVTGSEVVRWCTGSEVCRGR
ncbi:MAG: 3,4-dihydroxy-2-butanone-4-phosphate synthase [Acidilobaceae archaeon]